MESSFQAILFRTPSEESDKAEEVLIKNSIKFGELESSNIDDEPRLISLEDKCLYVGVEEIAAFAIENSK